MKRALILAAVLACTTAAPAMAAPGLDWKPCDGMECATITVPVDYAKPRGKTITLKLARARATGPDKRIGSVIMNPGGPSVSGIGTLKRTLPNFVELRRRFDIVTFDPRGFPGSDHLPEEHCLKVGPFISIPRTQAEFDAAAAENREKFAQCRETNPALFDNMSSANVARDVDAIRAAVGDRQLNFLANSYGGVIAASYARLFPQRVRTIFLDSIVGHVDDQEVEETELIKGNESTFKHFIEWCAKENSCKQNGQDVSRIWLDLLARAEKEPIPAKGSNPSVSFTGRDLILVGPMFLTNTEMWQDFSDALDKARNGDAIGFTPALFGGARLFGAAAALAVECADFPGLRTYEEFQALLEQERKLSPHFPGNRTGRRMFCVGFPNEASNPNGPINPKGLPPLLGAGDWREVSHVRSVTDTIPGSLAFEVSGKAAHGHYLNYNNRCVIGHADRYFAEKVLPPKGTVCTPSIP
ncbi:alpha/beta hydrolase [Allokutzneria sp. A3M-2-11 16]|uniref:alpha/beta fold hydrolase n=1 Tax=Allokutzneria sp. A3M-2-11 16 TaxID=2962043 RepID=UPI0020B8FDE2|nr:alpha/beta fold hydrolase [Allokutzneria sp. A3M-2-11 16]MCP3800645.1 alpha/beta hydrolase [Allokutzneria sp. A3M-2-11 16]